MRLGMFALALFLGVNAFGKVSFKTSLTCQQDEGDNWVEFGLRKVGDRTQVVVVEHDDTDHATLAARRYVTASRGRGRGNTILWKDASGTLQIQLHNVRNLITADFTLLKDGPGSLSQSGMKCYKESSISFDGWPHPEK